MPQIQPTLFISHGAPDILISQQASVEALRKIGSCLSPPRAVIVVSAHWTRNPVGITSGEKLATIHDFSGFPDELYRLEYPVKGDDVVSNNVYQQLQAYGIASELVDHRGLDHGAWIPLCLMFPEGDIPVIQVSLPTDSLRALENMGKILGTLRNEGVLIIGSGGSVHNLHALNRNHLTEDWAREFEAWLREAVEDNHFEWLVADEYFPRSFQLAHPTLEHYAPLVIAWAAASTDKPGRRIHHSFDYGNLGMSFFEFNGETILGRFPPYS